MRPALDGWPSLTLRIWPERNPHQFNCALCEHHVAFSNIAPISFGLTLARGCSIHPSPGTAGLEHLGEMQRLPNGYDTFDQKHVVRIAHSNDSAAAAWPAFAKGLELTPINYSGRTPRGACSG